MLLIRHIRLDMMTFFWRAYASSVCYFVVHTILNTQLLVWLLTKYQHRISRQGVTTMCSNKISRQGIRRVYQDNALREVIATSLFSSPTGVRYYEVELVAFCWSPI